MRIYNFVLTRNKRGMIKKTMDISISARSYLHACTKLMERKQARGMHIEYINGGNHGKPHKTTPAIYRREKSKIKPSQTLTGAKYRRENKKTEIRHKEGFKNCELCNDLIKGSYGHDLKNLGFVCGQCVIQNGLVQFVKPYPKKAA